MKQIIWSFAAGILLLTGTVSCKKKFDDYAVNPNLPVSVPPYLILRSVLNSMPVSPDGDYERWSQMTCRNYTYYGNNEYWSGSASMNYGVLNNIAAMEKEAKKTSGSDENPYAALGKFLRAYFFVDMTLKFGDVPMSDALKGLDNTTPKYDAQKQVFVQSLQLLEDANTMLTSLINKADVSLQGDFFFQERTSNAETPLNALKKWQKVVNTYKLRVLIELSKKDADAELGVKQKFADILANPTKYPIMTSMSDNLEFAYNTTTNQYPNNKDNYGFDALRLNMAATWLNTLAGLNDLRAMRVAEPARGLGYADTDFRSFVGASSGEDLSNMAAKVQQGKYSLYNRKRYYDGYTAENTFIISYPEMCFNIAEGINRGWAPGNAETWYQNGIWADMAFYNIIDGNNTVTFLKPNGLLGEYLTYTVPFSYTTYYNQSSVKYAGNNTAGLNQILTQKYLAFGRSTGLEPYYQWRRTGVPAFLTGPGTGNSNVIPLRFQYPSSERSTNGANLTASLASQYGGNDNINAKMWILN